MCLSQLIPCPCVHVCCSRIYTRSKADGLVDDGWNAYLGMRHTPAHICISSALTCACVQTKMCLLIHCSCSTWQSWIRGYWSNPWNWTSWIWKNLRRNNYNLSKQQTHACSSLPCSGFWPSTVDTGSRPRRHFHVVTPRKKILAYWGLISDAHLFPAHDASLWSQYMMLQPGPCKRREAGFCLMTHNHRLARRPKWLRCLMKTDGDCRAGQRWSGLSAVQTANRQG